MLLTHLFKTNPKSNSTNTECEPKEHDVEQLEDSDADYGDSSQVISVWNCKENFEEEELEKTEIGTDNTIERGEVIKAQLKKAQLFNDEVNDADADLDSKEHDDLFLEFSQDMYHDIDLFSDGPVDEMHDELQESDQADTFAHLRKIMRKPTFLFGLKTIAEQDEISGQEEEDEVYGKRGGKRVGSFLVVKVCEERELNEVGGIAKGIDKLEKGIEKKLEKKLKKPVEEKGKIELMQSNSELDDEFDTLKILELINNKVKSKDKVEPFYDTRRAILSLIRTNSRMNM